MSFVSLAPLGPLRSRAVVSWGFVCCDTVKWLRSVREKYRVSRERGA